MPRRTLPIPVQTMPPLYPDNALMQIRLIDFDTGSGELEEQHKTWLRASMDRAKTNSTFHIRIYGYASHLGTAHVNEQVSQARMNSVLKFMQQIDNRCLTNIEFWTRFSDRDSTGGRNDDSPEWRAAEVHIFIGDFRPPPPPGPVKPWKPTIPPLPGGPRYKTWAIATPGGAVATPLLIGPSFGFNMFIVKNILSSGATGDTRGYISPVIGGGISLSVPIKLKPGKEVAKSVLQILQTAGTSWSYSGMSFKNVTAPDALTWEELESCLVTVKTIGAGAVKGYSAAHVKFECPNVYRYDSSGQPNHFPETALEFDSSGEDWQAGASATAVGGPLYSVEKIAKLLHF